MSVTITYAIETQTGMMDVSEIYWFESREEAERQVPSILATIKAETGSPVYPMAKVF